jgi:hypothetical protein
MRHDSPRYRLTVEYKQIMLNPVMENVGSVEANRILMSR